MDSMDSMDSMEGKLAPAQSSSHSTRQVAHHGQYPNDKDANYEDTQVPRQVQLHSPLLPSLLLRPDLASLGCCRRWS